jgi:hypothetical protein
MTSEGIRADKVEAVKSELELAGFAAEQIWPN